MAVREIEFLSLAHALGLILFQEREISQKLLALQTGGIARMIKVRAGEEHHLPMALSLIDQVFVNPPMIAKLRQMAEHTDLRAAVDIGAVVVLVDIDALEQET